jgi:hypothetical protein
MKGLTDFEEAVLTMLLAGDDPTLKILQAQAEAGELVCRDSTGAGFFLSFRIPANAPTLAVGDFHFGDVEAEIEGMRHGAGFVIFVREGRLATLEGYSYGEPWSKNIRKFRLWYQRDPRQLTIPSN